MAFTYGTINKCTTADGTVPNVYEVRFGYELVELGKPEDNPSISTVKLQLEVRSTNSLYKPYGYNQTTTIDGTSLATKTFDLRSTNTWQIFGTRTIQVSHNSDGTYSATKSGSFTTNVTGPRPKSGTASVTVTLPTIPKASSITVNDANIGSGTNIVINKADNSFTTTIYYKASGQSSFTKIVDKTANQVYGWTVPTSFYSLIPNQRNITCQFYAETYLGNTLVGTSSTVSATFKANVYPTINSITAQTTDQKTYDLTNNRNTIIKGVSTLQIQVSATAGTGASIDHYVIGGVSQTSSTRPITQASSNTYSVSVYDTRGEPPTTQSITMPNAMINYVPLTISANIRRNQPTDGIVKINLSGNYFNDSFGAVPNTLTVEYRYKVSGASSWDQDWTSSGVTVTKSGNTYTASKDLSGMTYTNSYQFEVRATDQVGTQTITGIMVTKGQPIYWWDNEGIYLGNGKSINTVVNNLYCDRVINNNANNYVRNGIYYFTSGNSNVATDWMHLFIIGNGGPDVSQIGSSIVNDKLYYRKSNNGTWSNWKTLAFTSDIPTVPTKTSQLTNDSIGIDFITATRTSDQTIAGNNTITKYQLNSTSASNGSRLTFDSSNNSINVGSGVSYVEVCCQIYVFTRGANSLKTLYIYKNSTQVARYSQPMNEDYHSISIPTLILPVQQNDKITIQFRSGSGSTVLGGSESNAGCNFLTVRVIK